MKWLTALGLVTAGRVSAEDAKAKIAAYAPLLADYPAAAFTMETLKAAARCDGGWFPSYARIADVLDEAARDLDPRVPRERRIAAPEPPWPPPPETPEQQTRVAALVAEAKVALGVVAGGRNASRRAPPESVRLTAARRAEIAAECAAFKERFAAVAIEGKN